jgi:hypothetical protein
MRFMTMVRFDESSPIAPPPPELFQAMGEFAAEGARNGTLVDQGGLLPSAGGRDRLARQRHDQGN